MTERRPYDDARWKPLRLAILARDKWTCRECGKRADRVDHRVPWRQGGDWFAESNLEAVCRSCNTRRAYATGGRSGERRRELSFGTHEHDYGPRTALTWDLPPGVEPYRPEAGQ